MIRVVARIILRRHVFRDVIVVEPHRPGIRSDADHRNHPFFRRAQPRFNEACRKFRKRGPFVQHDAVKLRREILLHTRVSFAVAKPQARSVAVDDGVLSRRACRVPLRTQQRGFRFRLIEMRIAQFRNIAAEQQHAIPRPREAPHVRLHAEPQRFPHTGASPVHDIALGRQMRFRLFRRGRVKIDEFLRLLIDVREAGNIRGCGVTGGTHVVPPFLIRADFYLPIEAFKGSLPRARRACPLHWRSAGAAHLHSRPAFTRGGGRFAALTGGLHRDGGRLRFRPTGAHEFFDVLLHNVVVVSRHEGHRYTPGAAAIAAFNAR